MTKHLLREPPDKCMQELNQWRMSGRARSGLVIQGSGKAPAGEVKIGALQPSLGGFGSAPLGSDLEKGGFGSAPSGLNLGGFGSAPSGTTKSKGGIGSAPSGLDISTGGFGSAPLRSILKSQTEPLGGFGSAPLWTNHKKLKRSGLSPPFWSTDRRVRFQPAVIIAIENWKKETSAMNYRSEGRIPLSDRLRAFVG